MSLVICLLTLIIFFDIFYERANQIEYTKREENVPAFLERKEQGIYTREPLRVPSHIHVRRKLASWTKEGSSREEERWRNEVKIAATHHSTIQPSFLSSPTLWRPLRVPSRFPSFLFGGKNSRL